MIDFKSLTVDELDREGLKGAAFAVRFDQRLAILDCPDCLSVICSRWKYAPQCRQ